MSDGSAAALFIGSLVLSVLASAVLAKRLDQVEAIRPRKAFLSDRPFKSLSAAESLEEEKKPVASCSKLVTTTTEGAFSSLSTSSGPRPLAQLSSDASLHTDRRHG